MRKGRKEKVSLLQEITQGAPLKGKRGKSTEDYRLLTVRIPRSLLIELKKFAAERETSMSAIITELVRNLLKG